jgi:hypothetical protein
VVTVKITDSWDDTGSLLHRFQDLVLSLLTRTSILPFQNAENCLFSGLFTFPPSHSHGIIYGFFPCLTDKCWRNTPFVSLPALYTVYQGDLLADDRS